jgi:hypothetical protein
MNTHDRPQLTLTDAEESFFRDMRQLSVNEHGELILVGLTVEESIWAVDYRRRVNKSGMGETREARLRHKQLTERHELARLQAMLGAEHEPGLSPYFARR